MEFIMNIFWNKDENRIRAGYRIILQLVLLAAISFPLRFIITRPEDPSVAGLDYTLIRAVTGIITMLVSMWLITRFIDKRRLSGIGLQIDKKWWIDLVFGLVLGIVLMSSIFFIENSLGWISISESIADDNSSSSSIAIFIYFLFFIKVGFNEELLTRGYWLTNLSEGLNFKLTGAKGAIYISWLLTSLLFGIGHLSNPNATLIAGINIAAAGIFLGTAFVLTGRLAIPIGVHITWNFFQGNIFGFPVSGITTPDSSKMITIIQNGPENWTGGAFGPEAGLIGICAIFVGTLLTAAWVRFKDGQIVLHLPIAEPPEREVQAKAIEEKNE